MLQSTIDLFRRERGARRFFAAHAQSTIGSGVGDIALIVLAFQRLHSAWAISLVLLADHLPGMVLGPLFGAVADRWPRLRCAIAADIVRAAAFVGIGLVGSFGATVALALVAGAATGVASPAVLSALPAIVESERRAIATSLYGAISVIGRTAGPMLAGLSLAFVGAASLCLIDGVTFAVSALMLATLREPRRALEDSAGAPGKSLLADAREGILAAYRLPGVRVVIASFSGMLLFAALANVAELLLAHALGKGSGGYSMLVAASALGLAAGTLTGARVADPPRRKRVYIAGIAITGGGLASVAYAPSFPVALVAIAATGFGNGLVLVNARLLIQSSVPDGQMARVFAALETVCATAFVVAFLAAGPLIAALGVRQLFLFAGLGSVAVWALSARSLRRTWVAGEEPAASLTAAPASESRPAAVRGGGAPAGIAVSSG